MEDTKSIEKLIDTSIAENEYVRNVIKAYVGGNIIAEAKLYHEPYKRDEKMQRIQKIFGSDAKNIINEQLLKDMEVKRDNTRVAPPPMPPMPPKK